MANKVETPIIVVGAGISGLLLAQYLTQAKIPFRIFERREDLETTNVGWGLTLTWSLPTLRDLLPASLWDRLPEAYVDRAAVERGEASAFPFFDLSTGELKAKTPLAPETRRIRVSREKFRKLLAIGISVEVIGRTHAVSELALTIRISVARHSVHTNLLKMALLSSSKTDRNAQAAFWWVVTVPTQKCDASYSLTRTITT